MSSGLLSFSSLAAGGSVHSHIYYDAYYVGRIIGGADGPCTAWLHELKLGDFRFARGRKTGGQGVVLRA